MRHLLLVLCLLLGCHQPPQLAVEPETFYVKPAGTDEPYCGKSPTRPCHSAAYTLGSRVPKKLDHVVRVKITGPVDYPVVISDFEVDSNGQLQIEGDVTRDELEARARALGYEMPPKRKCSPRDGGYALRACGNVFVDTTINGCMVNGAGANVTVVCPDGGTLQDVVFE